MSQQSKTCGEPCGSLKDPNSKYEARNTEMTKSQTPVGKLRKRLRPSQGGAALELINRHAKRAGAGDEPGVVARESDGLSLVSKKIHGRQMKRIQCSHRLRERLQSPREHRWREFDERQPAEQRPGVVRVRSREFAGMNSCPDFILDKPAGDKCLPPELFGRRPVFGQEMREHNRGVQIDQRSLRSWSSSFCNLRKDVTGLRGGGVDPGRAGGVIQPLRTASASKASDSTGLLVRSGGTISATTRSRSVTSTVSPRSASRTYSLSLFFKTFKPTAFTMRNVAPSSYLCQGPKRSGVVTECWSVGVLERRR